MWFQLIFSVFLFLPNFRNDFLLWAKPLKCFSPIDFLTKTSKITMRVISCTFLLYFITMVFGTFMFLFMEKLRSSFPNITVKFLTIMYVEFIINCSTFIKTAVFFVSIKCLRVCKCLSYALGKRVMFHRLPMNFY